MSTSCASVRVLPLSPIETRYRDESQQRLRRLSIAVRYNADLTNRIGHEFADH